MADPAVAAPVLWALRLEYDGTHFVGWQRQHSSAGVSVQGVLEAAAAKLNRGRPVASIVAGRTDSGVHASGQVAQIMLPGLFTPDRLRNALNFHMKPHAVAVIQAAQAPAGWNARFSADQRHYRYRILNRPARPALNAGTVWHVPARLDEHVMAEAAKHLLGQHDFTSFRASACQAKSPVRTLERLDVIRCGDLIEITTEARSFLHHQVRNMVGSLTLVGEGDVPPGAIRTMLLAKDRAAAGPTAPSSGLTLMAVRYRTPLFKFDEDFD